MPLKLSLIETSSPLSNNFHHVGCVYWATFYLFNLLELF